MSDLKLGYQSPAHMMAQYEHTRQVRNYAKQGLAVISSRQHIQEERENRKGVFHQAANALGHLSSEEAGNATHARQMVSPAESFKDRRKIFTASSIAHKSGSN